MLMGSGTLIFLLSARSGRRAKRQISMSSSSPCHTAAFTKPALLEWFVCSAHVLLLSWRDFHCPQNLHTAITYKGSCINPCCFLINHGWRLTVEFKTSVGLSHVHHSTFTLLFLPARRHAVHTAPSDALLLAPFSLDNHLSCIRRGCSEAPT